MNDLQPRTQQLLELAAPALVRIRHPLAQILWSVATVGAAILVEASERAQVPATPPERPCGWLERAP